MDNSTLIRIQSRFLILGGVVLLSNVFLTLFLCGRRLEMKRDIEIDKARFYDAVKLGTSNFLESVTLCQEEQKETHGRFDSSVRVQFVDNLTTWLSPRFGMLCRMDDSSYRQGDYCDFGVIVSIADGRVYVDSGDGVVIVRRRASGGDAPTKEARASDARGNEQSRAIHE